MLPPGALTTGNNTMFGVRDAYDAPAFSPLFVVVSQAFLAYYPSASLAYVQQFGHFWANHAVVHVIRLEATYKEANHAASHLVHKTKT